MIENNVAVQVVKSMFVETFDSAIFFMVDQSQQSDNFLESENLTLDVARKLIRSQQQQIEDVKKLVEKLQGKTPTPRLDESYSLSAE